MSVRPLHASHREAGSLLPVPHRVEQPPNLGRGWSYSHHLHAEQPLAMSPTEKHVYLDAAQLTWGKTFYVHLTLVSSKTHGICFR